jgi:hypothetical protein
LTQRDNGKFESLANDVLVLDSKILSIMIVGVRSGSTFAEVTNSDFKQKFGLISQRSNGMAGRWGILAFNSMERLGPVPSSGKYLVMVGENYIGMMFPANVSEDVMIELIVDPKADPAGIYTLVHTYLKEESKNAAAH